MKKPFYQTTGWCGMVIILLAYFLLSFDFLSADSVWYQGLNVLGSLGIVLETWMRRDYQPMVLNIIWILIAIVAIVRLFV